MAFPLQESFAAGEISPLLRGRPGTEGYKAGCAKLVNFRPDARGPAIARIGSLFISEFAGNGGRVFDITGERDTFFIGLLTDQNLKIFRYDGQPVSTATPLITEPRFDNGGAAWTTTVSPQSSISFAYQNALLKANMEALELITNGDFASLGAGWTVREDNNSTVEFFPGQCLLTPDQGGGGNERIAGISQQITGITPLEQHVLEVAGDFSNGNLRVLAGLTDGSSEFLEQIVGGTGGVLDFTPSGDFWITINCEKPQVEAIVNLVSVKNKVSAFTGDSFARISQGLTGLTVGNHIVLVTLNTPAENVSIRIGTGDNDGSYLDQLVTGTVFQVTINIPATSATVSVHVDATSTASIKDIILLEVGTEFDMPTPWPENTLAEIHIIRLPGNNEIHFLHKNYPPQRIIYDILTETFAFDPVPVGNFPSEWAGSSWPRAGTFLWGRLWYGGTVAEPQQFWGSSTLDWSNFDTTGASSATDPVTYTIQKFGTIKWMAGTKALLVGTTVAEYIVSSSSRFTDLTEVPDILQQSSYGSSFVQAIEVGDQVFYVSADQRKVRAIQYEWSADNWLSQDLTFFSEHITKAKVREIAWQQNPNNVLLMTLEDGTAAALSYQRDQNIWGWSLFESTLQVLSITAPVINGVNLPVMLGIINPGNIQVVYPSLHRSGFVDSYVSRVDTVAFTTLSGLDHLEGRTVQVLADDPDNPNKATDMLAVQPDAQVVGGQITLQEAHTEALAGLSYTPELTTLPLEVPSQTGTQLPHMKHHGSIYVAVRNTMGITINGQRPADRTPQTPMNTREPDKTELVAVSDQGWTRGGEINIKQELPLPATILYIASKTSLEHV